jgi:hypothetical protein
MVQKLTKRQAAVISLYTGILVSRTFGDVQELGDELMGRPTWTHEYAGTEFVEELKEKVKDEFLQLVPEEES